VIFAWTGFLVFIGIVLALDLGVFNKKAHAPTLREATLFTAGTVVMASAFAVLIKFAYDGHWLTLGNHLDAVDGKINDGSLAAIKFLTGYVVELSLSIGQRLRHRVDLRASQVSRSSISTASSSGGSSGRS